jgi:hypothetical protein
VIGGRKDNAYLFLTRLVVDSYVRDFEFERNENDANLGADELMLCTSFMVNLVCLDCNSKEDLSASRLRVKLL